MIKAKYSLIIILVSIFILPQICSAEEFYCEGKIPSDSDVTKEIKIHVRDGANHLISLVPINPEVNDEPQIYSDIPVGIGYIEINEALESSRLQIAKGKLIVTDKQPNIIAGILIDDGRQYSIRLDKSISKWTFVLHDTDQKETVIGSCK